MNVTLKQLKAFVELANCQSYVTASQRLNISQPAISICIKNLEQEVGGELFDRSTRVVELTQEGKALYPKARKLLQDWLSTFEEVNDLFTLQQGRLTVAAMPSFAASRLPLLLKAFNQAYPNIRLDVIDVVMEHVLASVRTGEADLGIVFEPDDMADLEFVPLLDNQFVVALYPGHALENHQVLALTDLAAMNIVMMNRGSSIRQWLEQAFSELACSPNISAEAWQLDTLGEMVRAELGLALVPELCRHQMTRKGLTCIPLQHSGLHRKVGIIRKPNSPGSYAAKAFTQLLLQRFRAPQSNPIQAI